MAGSVDAGAAEDELCQVSQSQKPQTPEIRHVLSKLKGRFLKITIRCISNPLIQSVHSDVSCFAICRALFNATPLPQDVYMFLWVVFHPSQFITKLGITIAAAADVLYPT